jgi:hypothetical protein
VPSASRIVLTGSVLLLVLLVLSERHRVLEPHVAAHAAAPPATTSPGAGLLYGRVTTGDAATYTGRLRFGGDEEALWGHFFNGARDGNPWAAHAGGEPTPLSILGVEFGRDHRFDRLFMARFGDIARIDAPVTGRFFQFNLLRGRELRVTMKSGTVFHLDRFAADDFADGVRVWDVRRGVVDLEEWRIRSIEFLPAAGTEAAPRPLHGTVRTAHGAFTGLIQWTGEESLDSDALVGVADDREITVRLDAVHSVVRRSRDSSRVALLDGRSMVLSGTRGLCQGHGGISVDDIRYGRVLVSCGAFDRIDFTAGGGAPAYDDFPRGRPLLGVVTTRTGRRLTGRVVYDLDESETTETLDAPSRGVDYHIPFGLIASIAPGGGDQSGGVRVTLHHGEELVLEREGDLSDRNPGMLIFGGGREHPEHVPWSDVRHVEFDRPPAMYPPLVGPR